MKERFLTQVDKAWFTFMKFFNIVRIGVMLNGKLGTKRNDYKKKKKN